MCFKCGKPNHLAADCWGSAPKGRGKGQGGKGKSSGGKIISVGTTTLRLLESAFSNDDLHYFDGETDIFIKPGYKFKIVDILLTNFHLPKSSLMLLVSAFAGFEKIQALYKHAIQDKYRFFSYGDVSLLFKNE